MDKTACVPPIAGAIEYVDRILGPNRRWGAINDRQADFLQNIYTPQRLAELALVPERESIASRNVDEVNAKLAEWKCSIRLNRITRGGFGTASKMDVAVEWPVVGETHEIQLMTGAYVPGVLISDNVSFTHSRRLGVIANIQTKNGDTVHLASEVDAPGGLELVDYVTQKTNDVIQPITDYSGVHFPMVYIKERPDLSWLLGMETFDANGDLWFIAQSLQETTFGMNEKGARAKSAVAIGMTRGMTFKRKLPLVINTSFLVWVMRPGISIPLFVGFIQQEHMKNPGDLGLRRGLIVHDTKKDIKTSGDM